MRWLGLFLCSIALAMPLSEALAETVQFVACPVYRDTDAGRKSGCWLSDDPSTGQRFDVSLAPTKPDWNRAILVEGRFAKDQVNSCGGKVLDPVRVSVLDQPCVRAMIPAEGFPGRKFVLPERNVRPLYVKRKPLATPHVPQDYFIPFDFGSDFVSYQLADYYLDQAIEYALETNARRIDIVGFASTRPMFVSGMELVEPAQIAEARAKRVREWMRLRGVPMNRVNVSWEMDAQPIVDAAFDGLTEPSFRRAEIRVTPATAE